MAQPVQFSRDFDPQTGVAVGVAEGVARITAPNASPYTFTGTNSFLIGGDPVYVLDPGPNAESHFRALTAAIGGRRVGAILITHAHRDHCALARRLARAADAPVWFEGRHRPSRPPRVLERLALAAAADLRLVPDRRLFDGERLDLGGVSATVVATPGHCANHLAFGLDGAGALLTGDHVMGWSSTMISVPDGSLAAYLHSLGRLAALPYDAYHPAHGGPVVEGPRLAAALKAHREMRNAEVVAAVEGGVTTLGGLLAAVYPDLTLALRAAARMTLMAHVEYLAGLELIGARPTPLGLRLWALR